MFPPNDQTQQYPPGYPPQQPPQQPYYPPPQQGMGQQAYYPPQGAPPAPPTAQGTLDGFFGEPSAAGGPALKFKDKAIGTTYTGIVARRLGNGDVRQQTDPSGRPLTYRDGRPKFVMVVPLFIPGNPEFPEGRGSWWVKGQARDELVRAMHEAGAPEGPPEEGAGVKVTLVGHRPIPGLNPQYLYEVRYIRPDNAGQAQPAPQPQAAQAQPVPPPQQAVQAPQAPAPVAQTPAQAPPATPAGLSDEQAALLAKLTG
jgi:hypothetical protein